MLLFKDKQKNDIELKKFLELEKFNGSVIFNFSPQDKAETCIDYLEITDNKLNVHSYDSFHVDSFKLKSKKAKEYIQIMRDFSDSTTIDSVIMHYKNMQKNQKRSLKM
tara:strand:- start:31517 stop:31840 length:324 start_codon:yes stop_codon:yes gene_type:complete